MPFPPDSPPPPGARVSIYGRAGTVAESPGSYRPSYPAVWVLYDEPFDYTIFCGGGRAQPVTGTWAALDHPSFRLLGPAEESSDRVFAVSPDPTDLSDYPDTGPEDA